MTETLLIGVVGGIIGIAGTLLGTYVTWRLRLKDRRRAACVRFLAVSQRAVNLFLSLISGRDLVRRRLTFVSLLDQVTDAQSELLVLASPRVLAAADELNDLVMELVPTVTEILTRGHPWKVMNVSDSPQAQSFLDRWGKARGNFVLAVDRELSARGFLARRRARSRWSPNDE